MGMIRFRMLALLLACIMLLGIVRTTIPDAKASEPVENAELVWDMEDLPDDLYKGNIGWDLTTSYGGHSKGYIDAVRADGKGRNGTAAAAITFTEKAGVWSLGANGVCLRIDQDESANANWLGATQFWFWLDVSEFEKSELVMDLLVDGVYPEANKPYYLISDNVKTEHLTTKGPDSFGQLAIPNGFVGWVGIDLDSFNASFGVIQYVGFKIVPSADWTSFPLSMYVDDFYILRDETEGSALHGEGELFNKNVEAGQSKLYTNLTMVHQTVESYGASGAWWATTYGTQPFVDTLLEMMFTDEGAGLNNYRHNVGGSVQSNLSDAGNSMSIRATLSPLTEDGAYDVHRDIGGYTVLMKLKKLGTIDDFTFFMNSPPSNMTKNGKTFADLNGESLSNLREDCYEAYAEYVVDVIQVYNDFGIPIKYVSPINEPQYDWNLGNQEGCHYEPTEAIRILELIAGELQQRCLEDPSLEDVRISFAESGTWYDKNYINYLYWKLYTNEAYSDKFAHIGAHSYAAVASHKENLVKELWNVGVSVGEDVIFRQTEFAYGAAQPDLTISSAVDIARVMHEDLSILSVDGWSFWLAGANGSYSDGLVYYNIGQSDIVASKRLWAMGQYARFTKGAIRVEADEYGMPENVFTTAYVNVEDNTLVYVIINDSGADQTFSFMGLPEGSVAEIYETSSIRSLESRGTMTADAGYTLPAESITTFVFHDVDYEAVESGKNPDNPSGYSADPDFDYSIFKTQESQTPTEPVSPSTEPTEPAGSDMQPNDQDPVWIPAVIIAVVVLLLFVIVFVIIRRKDKEG